MLDIVTSVVINAIIFSYILSLEKEKCKCSRGWMRDVIKALSLFFVIVNIIIILYLSTIKSTKHININGNNFIKIMISLYVFLAFYYWITCLVYFIKLKKVYRCQCSNDWKRYMLITPMILLATSFTFLIFFAFVFLILKGFTLLKI